MDTLVYMHSSVSVMVNGYPTQPFRLEKGIRQGDPISPFFSTIVSEALNFVIHKTKEQGLVSGVFLVKTMIN